MATTYTTSDLGLAAWLNVPGQNGRPRLDMVKCERESGGRFSFVFADPNNQGDTLAVAFTKSESAQFDQQMRLLKSLLMNRSSGHGPMGSRAPGAHFGHNR